MRVSVRGVPAKTQASFSSFLLTPFYRIDSQQRKGFQFDKHVGTILTFLFRATIVRLHTLLYFVSNVLDSSVIVYHSLFSEIESNN